MLIQTLGVYTNIYGTGDNMSISRSLIISLVGFLIVFAVLGVIALYIKGVGAIFDAKAKHSKEKAPEQASAAEAAVHPAAPVNGPVLEGVSEKEAAVVMALVSHESGIPLERLQFNSIKLTEEIKK